MRGQRVQHVLEQGFIGPQCILGDLAPLNVNERTQFPRRFQFLRLPLHTVQADNLGPGGE